MIYRHFCKTIVLVVFASVLTSGCTLAHRVVEKVSPEPPSQAVIATLPPLASPTVRAGEAVSLREGADSTPSAVEGEALGVSPQPLIQVWQPTPTPTEVGLSSFITEWWAEPTATSTPRRVVQVMPTFTPTATPSPTSTPTSTPTETPLPTATPLPTNTPIPTNTPLPTDTPEPTSTPTNTPRPYIPPPTNTPTPAPPTLTPKPVYDFLLNEFFNSPTNNPFMVMYVSVTDINDIPIGGMKVVGTRLDHNLTYESPLSTWHFEGYSAPGEVVKTGNLKFEPPGGIESTKWLIHLQDANGVRMSDDVPFHTNQDNRQWYFVKFKRKF